MICLPWWLLIVIPVGLVVLLGTAFVLYAWNEISRSW